MLISRLNVICVSKPNDEIVVHEEKIYQRSLFMKSIAFCFSAILPFIGPRRNEI